MLGLLMVGWVAHATSQQAQQGRQPWALMALQNEVGRGLLS